MIRRFRYALTIVRDLTSAPVLRCPLNVDELVRDLGIDVDELITPEVDK